MKNTVDLNLIEELSNLEYFVVKAAVNGQDFWKEWQEKYSRALISRIALRKLLKTKKLSYEDAKRYRAMLETYQEILSYLEGLKKLALDLKGFSGVMSSGLDDEDVDFDL
ncbi:MAG: hypothetical protein N3C13_03525 [Aquificaceae bacterium]|nr:hypothetical protein [Aquificaceae bacterium]MCX8060250.1 hypothetical protein [Aquificaceae bacterium]MDW8097416.1 hypothetical protein [Aquificaceae bacterium]